MLQEKVEKGVLNDPGILTGFMSLQSSRRQSRGDIFPDQTGLELGSSMELGGDLLFRHTLGC